MDIKRRSHKVLRTYVGAATAGGILAALFTKMMSVSASFRDVMETALSTTYVLPRDELSTLVNGGSPTVTGRRSNGSYEGRYAEKDREAHCKEDLRGLFVYESC